MGNKTASPFEYDREHLLSFQCDPILIVKNRTTPVPFFLPVGCTCIANYGPQCHCKLIHKKVLLVVSCEPEHKQILFWFDDTNKKLPHPIPCHKHHDSFHRQCCHADVELTNEGKATKHVKLHAIEDGFKWQLPIDDWVQFFEAHRDANGVINWRFGWRGCRHGPMRQNLELANLLVHSLSA